jgi:hypothetical protein
MNSVIINNIPSTSRKEFGYKSINASHEHNDNQEAILEDILDLYNKTNAIERVITENMDFIKYENGQLEAINAMILDRLDELKSQYDEIVQNAINRKVSITPASCEIYDNTFGAIIDKRTASITSRPSLKVSKFAVFDDVSDSIFLPDTLNVNILNRSNVGIVTQTDNDIYAPFYKDNNLYWTRKCVTDGSVESIMTDYIITLPEDIMTTPEMNEIYINPFMCKVMQIYTRYGDSTLWESVSGIDFNPGINQDTDTIESSIKSYRPIRINFANKKVNQIKITVKCDTYQEGQTNLRTFMYGLKEVGGYINYYSNYDTSSFQFDVTIPEEDNYLVTGIQVYFNNGSEFGNYSKDWGYDMYYKDASDNYHKITDNFPFTPTTHDLRVKVRFGERYNEMNIKKIEVSYKKI